MRILISIILIADQKLDFKSELLEPEDGFGFGLYTELYAKAL